MKTETIDIDLLKEFPDNPRIHNENQIVEMAKSIERFGQIRPMVIDENNVLLAGHGIRLALKHLKRKEGDILRITGLSENEKKKLVLADNKIAELGSTDYDKVFDLVKTLGDDLDIPGFDEKILNDLVHDVEEVLDNYGTVKIDEVKESAKQEEQKDNTPFFERKEQEPVKERREHEKAYDQRKIVICPHCNGEIEL